MFTGDLTTEQGKQDYENYIMNNVRNEINSYTKQTQNSNSFSTVTSAVTNNAAFPSGVIVPFAGGPTALPNPGIRQDVPDGWLLCVGTAISRTAYSSLFTVIGTTYGVGDGSTTFNLPDLRGNVPVGVKSTQTSNPDIRRLGLVDGAYTYTITANDLPTHTHAVGTLVFTGNAVPSGVGSAHTHTFTGALASFNASHGHADNFTAPAHTHSTSGTTGIKYFTTGSLGGSASVLAYSGSTATLRDTAAGTTGGASSTTMTGSVTSATTGTGGNLDHTHGLGTLANVNESAHTHSVTATGTISGSTGNNTTTATTISLVQPSIALNYIIKT